MNDYVCDSCVFSPPSSGDGKPCTQCVPNDPVWSCYEPKEAKMNIDTTLQNAYKALQSVHWHVYLELGGDKSYYDWYYAEDQLYVIRDRIMEQYYFVRARSPLGALKKFKERIDNFMKEARKDV